MLYRIELVHIRKFIHQLKGSVDQDRKVLGADPVFAALIKKDHQGNVFVTPIAMNTSISLIFCHYFHL